MRNISPLDRALIASSIRCAALALALTLPLAAAGHAQDAPPARNGNVYDGTAHQPTAGTTTSQEQSAGVAPAPAQAQSERDQLQQLGQQTLQRAQTPTATAAGCSADGKVCPDH